MTTDSHVNDIDNDKGTAENKMVSTAVNPLEALSLPQPLLLGSGSFTRKLILKEMNIPFVIVSRPIDEDAIGNRHTDPPEQLVLTLAHAKMKHLVQEIQAGRCDSELATITSSSSTRSTTTSDGDGAAATTAVSHDFIVLTGDQVVTCNGHILEKPQSVQQAKEFVAMYGSHPPSTVGSCVLTHLPTNTTVSGVDTATIYFQSSLSATTSADDTTNEDGTVHSSASGGDADALVDAMLAEGAPILSCAGGLMIEHELVQNYVHHIDGTVDSVMGLSKPLVSRLLHELSEKIKIASESNTLEN